MIVPKCLWCERDRKDGAKLELLQGTAADPIFVCGECADLAAERIAAVLR